MKKYLSALVCGFGAGVLMVVPVAKSFTCCLIIPFAAFLSLVLENKANPSIEKITAKKALMFGLMTGLFAALFGSFFDLFITLVTKQNDIVAMFPELQNMVNSFPLTEDVRNEILELFQIVRDDIINYGFSPLYALSVILSNFSVNIVFGMIGGLVGSNILNKKLNNTKEQ